MLVAGAGCGVRYGFSGGGLDPDIKTMAVTAFDNKTTSPDLQQELFEFMREELRRRLGVRDAPQDRANAVVTGIIQQFQADLPVGVSADPTQVSTRRRLQITVDIQITRTDNKKSLYEARGLVATADYAERGEVEARKKALTTLLNDIVSGVQSKW
jgi:hypothetical protein